MPELADYIHRKREHDAEQQRGCEGKVKRRVLAAIQNVSRESAQWNTCAPEQQKHRADDEQDRAEKHEDFAELFHESCLNNEEPEAYGGSLIPVRIILNQTRAYSASEPTLFWNHSLSAHFKRYERHSQNLAALQLQQILYVADFRTVYTFRTDRTPLRYARALAAEHCRS